MNLHISILSLLLVSLAACNATTDPQQFLRIAISPAAHPINQAVLTCAPRDENLFVSIDSLYPGTFALEDYDLFIRLGQPEQEDAFAVQLAWDQIVAILNAENTLQDLSRSQIADLFSGRVSTWDELGGSDDSVTLWTSPPSDEARLLLTNQILLGSPVAGHAYLAPSPDVMLTEVIADPSALGLLPAAWADESVQQIEIDLEVPVLAVSLAEPSGAARQLLACLQSEIGQAVLAESYRPFVTE